MVRKTLPGATLILALFSIACVTTPVTHRKAFNILPDGVMNQLGADAYGEMKAGAKLSGDRRKVAVIEEIGQRIADASGKRYDWEVAVFDDPDTANAFCLPGGKIGVFTGLFPVAENEAGMAAIIGHEVAHAVARHGAERMSQNLVVGLGLGLAEITLENSEHRETILGLMGVGAQLGVLLPYSRTHESEADRIGLEYMAKAGYDPREAPKLWKRMAGLGQRVPEFLSTHPDPIKRANKLKSLLPQVMPLYEKSRKRKTQRLPQ